jgi:hypothetical protein
VSLSSLRLPSGLPASPARLLASRTMSATAWSAYDEGYLRAYQWSAALAAGAALPTEAAPVQLGPGEVAHARFAPVGLAGYFGEEVQYQRSLFLFGGPIGLAVTGAASLARNAAKKAEAQRAAVPRWHNLGTADLAVTSQRLVLAARGQVEAFWYAETGPLELTTGDAGGPAVRFQPAGKPVLRVDSPWAPLVYVFVHHVVDGRPPGVPAPAGLLERARAEGRLQ